ncbi:MAG: hypothetical protein N2053_05085 [Chitinispirillaceae bacterium]|nr:hypothetical protein [Chitinispirillaceae bacterium]
MKNSSLIYYLIFLFFISPIYSDANQSDSLNYFLLRENIVSKYSLSEVILTADELAKAGLYREAIELLIEFEKPKDDTKKLYIPSKSNPFSKKTKLRVSTGIDYYHLEDIDTSAMTPEEWKDYKRLTETPMSIWQRTTLSVSFDSNFITHFSPEVYNSQRKSLIAMNTEFSLPYSIIIKPEIRLQKWHLNESSFEPIKPLPSDMIGGIFQINKDKTYTENTKYSIPFTFNIENYRYDSPGYESYIEFRISPSLDLNIKYLNLQTRLFSDFQYENYLKPESDTLDVFRTQFLLEGLINKKKYKGNIHIRACRDYYTKAFNPNIIDRFESSLKIENINIRKIKYGIRLKYLYEREKYRKNGNSITIRGTELTTKPFVEYYIFRKRFLIGSDIFLEKRFSDKIIPYFIWEERSSLETAILFGWKSSYSDILVRTAYRYEDIDEFFEIFKQDNRSLKESVEISINPFSFLSINLLTDYHYRLYANFTPSARVSENLTLSFNVSLRF